MFFPGLSNAQPAVEAFLGKAKEVQETDEFRRIAALPWLDWQAHVTHNDNYLRLSTALKTPQGVQALFPVQAAALTYLHDYGGAFCPIAVGGGKALAHGEPVLLARGWTPIEQVTVGDQVFGSDGRVSNVTGVFPQGVRPVYELTFSDGSRSRCDVDHLWTLEMMGRRGKRVTLSVRQLLQRPLFRWAPGKSYKIRNYKLPTVMPLRWRYHEGLALDPYTLGVLLGDACMSTGTVTLTSPDPEIVASLVLPAPVQARVKNSQNAGQATEYVLTGCVATSSPSGRSNPLNAILKAYGLWGGRAEDKFIPRPYLQASPEQRLALLQGLFDTDGYVENARAGYCTVSPQLARDVQELVESLGGVCTLHRKENEHQGAYVLLALFPRDVRPFRIARKRGPYEKRLRCRQRDPFRMLCEIRYLGELPCTCISVDAFDSLYVTRNHILTHNTLTSFLAPRIANAQRPALFIPASLREKTWREFQVLYRHWFGPTIYMRRKSFDQAVFNYEELSREGGQKRLNAYQPDLIVADEVQALKNRDASCTKAVEHYMFQHHNTRFVGLTATPTSRELMDFWHIMFWCLRHHMPLPRIQAEARIWSDAVKEAKQILTERPRAGALRAFLRAGDLERIRSTRAAWDFGLEHEVETARVAFSNRFASAPGVIVYEDDEGVGASIQIQERRMTPGPEAQACLARIRKEKKTPNNVDIQTPMEMWKIARELVCGFYYLWDPPPPKEWLSARSALGWYYRQILQRDGIFYDRFLRYHVMSPAQIAQRIQAGVIQDQDLCEAYFNWIEIKPTYSYTLHAIWVDDAMVRFACDWLAKEGGIVWTEHLAFGQRVAQAFGTGFCGEQGLDANGVLIDDYRGKPVVASVGSNHKGRNLQAWNKNLLVTVPPNGARIEQLLGRTHRRGQMADTVFVDWVNGCPEQEDGFIQMRADARYIESTLKQKQKLNYADYV